MQPSKIIFRYWWLLLLTAVAVGIFTTNFLKERFNNSETSFAVSKPQQITHISIESPTDTLLLQRLDGDTWVMNQGISANRSTVDMLLNAISHINVSSPIPLSAVDNAKNNLRFNGTKVSIFAHRKLIKSYTLYHTNELSLKTIGRLKGANTIQKIELAGHGGSVIELFNPSEIHWQSNRLPLPAIQSINSVEVEIPNDIEQSFRIDVLDDKSLRLFELSSGNSAQKFDTTRLQEFLFRITNLTFKEVANLSMEAKAAVVYTEPDFIFNISTSNGKKHTISTFPIPIDEYIDEFGRPVQFDLNRLYITLSGDKNIYIANYIDIHHILKGLNHFR